MHDYLRYIMMIQPITETSLILFDVSNEEKGRIVRQYNRALENARGEGTDVAQIFLKPLIAQYQKWGDPALIFGLCLAREGQFKRAEGSLTYAISGTLGSEQQLSIAQEALRFVREDIKNPPSDLPPADLAGKIRNAKMASDETPAGRVGFQAPILMRAQRANERPQMATTKERRDIMMRSGGVGDELPDDSINIEDVASPGEKMRRAVTVLLVMGALALVVIFVIFGVIPLIHTVTEGGDAKTKLDYLTGELNKVRGDVEISSIMEAYDARFSIPAETDSNGNPVTYTTTTPPTTPETTTESTTALTAFIVNTDPSETSGQTTKGN
ncbi:MAG: hypothetical protein Q3987_03325 [Oscillospiraceae bacterium]|nr:hypothetical protein [Oscillospiraceae bacterium]